MDRIKLVQIRPFSCFFFLMLFASSVANAQLVELSGPTSGIHTSNTRIRLLPGFYTTGPFHAYITGDLNVQLGSTPSQNVNYIRTKTYKVASATEIINPMVSQQSEMIQYFDGLARPSQTIQTKGSPLGNDIVQHIGYDAYDRETEKYLPYAEQVGNGAFKTAANNTQAQFYSSSGWDASVVKTTAPYAQTVFEPSPLNRVTEQGAPGTVWQPSSARTNIGGRTLLIAYGTNDASTASYGTTGYGVRLWNARTVSGQTYKRNLITTGNYAAGQLSLKIMKDENWTSGNGKAGTTEEYTDRAGHLILKRTFNTDLSVASTYYVYDDPGNLCFVLTPGSDPDSGNISQTALDQFCYQYRYDGKNRLIEKRIAGKGWDYLIYNNRDQLVLSQDSVLHIAGQWAFTKYDVLGREIIRGLYNDASSRVTLENMLNAETVYWENPQTTDIGYTNTAFPRSVSAYFSIRYFDHYTFPGVNDYQYTATTKTNGLLTGSKIYIIGTSKALLSVNYYDDEGRVSKAYKQHYQSGEVNVGNYDEVINTYNFEGMIIAGTRIHHNVNSESITIFTRYDYDHTGRRLRAYEKINNDEEVLISENRYNEIGQLKEKIQGSGRESTSFAYNERGWLIQKTASLFAMQLKYNDGSIPRYNGNVANQLWGIPGNLSNNFTYNYDALNRIISGDTGKGIYEKDIVYDVMGNITNLNRNNTGIQTYEYGANTGNRLNRVRGGVSRLYTYDGNGNALTDGTNTMTYNLLNLPETSKGAVSVSYTYDATGAKLKMTSGGITTDYIDGIQYTAGIADVIQTEEGLARKSGSTYVYEYIITDHLGNNRTSFDIYNNAARTIQHDDYYPFGKVYDSYSLGTKNNYLYNGKELQEALSQYDYGARFYDPIIGRWNVVDPMAEKAMMLSPYSYTDNNPVNNIDPDGMLTFYGEMARSMFVLLQDGATNYDQYQGGSQGDPPKKKSNGYFSSFYKQSKTLRPFEKVGNTWHGWLSSESTLGSDLFNIVSDTYWNVASLMSTDTYVDFYNSQLAYWSSSSEEKGIADANSLSNMIETSATLAPFGAIALDASVVEAGVSTKNFLNFKSNGGYGVKSGNFEIMYGYKNSEGGTIVSYKSSKGTKLRLDFGPVEKGGDNLLHFHTNINGRSNSVHRSLSPFKFGKKM